MGLTCRDVIKRSGRLHGAWAGDDDPTASEADNALLALNSMQRALFGTIIGPRLSPQSLSGNLAQAENGGQYLIPAASFTLTAPLNPRSGARFAVVDGNLNFATNSLTVIRNGRLLEGAAANLVLNTAGDDRQWFFRGDTGSWTREADFATLDVVPYYPDELIAYLPYMLAVVIAAEYGGEIRPDVAAGNAEGRASFARVYARRGRNAADPPIFTQVQASAQGAA